MMVKKNKNTSVISISQIIWYINAMIVYTNTYAETMR